jgi:hypothetical protein
MDMRTGEIYQGEPRDEHSERVTLDAEIVTVLTGPFKGRRYQVINGRRGARIKPDAKLDDGR